MTYALDYIDNTKHLDSPLKVSLGDNIMQLAHTYSDALVWLPTGHHITISNVYYVPGLNKSLISVNTLTIILLNVQARCMQDLKSYPSATPNLHHLP